jgi:hypothetical protein
MQQGGIMFGKHKKGILVAVASFLLATAAYAQMESVGSLVVVDANDKEVGEVIGFVGKDIRLSGAAPSDPVVAFKVKGYLFALGVKRDAFVSHDVNVLFADADCLTTPHIRTLPLASMRFLSYPLLP